MEFYSFNSQLAEAFGSAEPIETFTNWSEGQSVTITGKKVGNVFFQNDQGSLVAFGASGRGTRLTFLLTTSASSVQQLRLEDGTNVEVDTQAIPLASLAKVFKHLVVDEVAEAQRAKEWLGRGAKPAQIAEMPRILREVTLERNEWQRIFVAIYNDVDAKLKAHANKAKDYKSGASMEARAERICAFVGERALVFAKDANEDPSGERRYYAYRWKDASGSFHDGLKSRTYWKIEGVSDEEVAQYLKIAEEEKISTVFSTTRLEKDFDASNGQV